VAQDFSHAIADSQATPAGIPSRRADARSPLTRAGTCGVPGGPGLGTPGLGGGIPSLDGGLAPKRAGTISMEPTVAVQPEPKEEPWRPRCFRQPDAQETKEEESAKTETPQYKGLFGQGAAPTIQEQKTEPAKPVHYGLFGAR
jgi:hypothetical protein